LTAKWRVNPIRHYDLMEDQRGVDYATSYIVRTTIKSNVTSTRKVSTWTLIIICNTSQMSLHFMLQLTKLFHHHS